MNGSVVAGKPTKNYTDKDIINKYLKNAKKIITF